MLSTCNDEGTSSSLLENNVKNVESTDKVERVTIDDSSAIEVTSAVVVNKYVGTVDETIIEAAVVLLVTRLTDDGISADNKLELATRVRSRVDIVGGIVGLMGDGILEIEREL